MKSAIAAIGSLGIVLLSSQAAIAQPIRSVIEIPKSNFFPNSTPSRSSAPSAPASNSASDLQKTPDTKLPEPVANKPKETKLSPLQRPLFRLFGFETAYTLKQQELVFYIAGISFNNPKDFRGDSNRSNDTNIGLAYGISDNLQVSIGAAGKNDTIFRNLVRPSSDIQLLYSNFPLNVKWQYLDQDRLAAAVVLGVEFSSPVPIIQQPGRSVFFSILNNNGTRTNQFEAKDNTPYLSLAFPLAYKVTDQLSLHLNPQVSFFPSSIPATTTIGSTGALIDQNVGFNGDRLDYYGTVAGIGIGVNYTVTPKLQIAADITPVFSGRNSVGVSDDSLFVRRAVWNIGLQFAPNSRTAASIYATNRFGPSSSAASNLLVQPNGEYAIGAQFTFLPDITGNYQIENRESYPKAAAFFTNLNGLPSAVLPNNSILYQLSFGTNGRVNPTVRLGILDDLELAINYSNNNVEVLPTENSITARYALVQDEGKNYSYSSALGIGLILNVVSKERDQGNNLALYADLPTSYRVDDWGIDFKVTPKLIIPAQFQGVQNILAVTVGANVKLAENTQIIGEYTPIISGNNQLQTSFTSSGFQTIPLSGKTGIYNIGLRQLFPNGNSVYALDLYFTNSSGDYGLQGVSALSNGGSQVGLRFNILNGVPESRKPD
ncbi:hypothetical protein Syn7502_02899 [Synechococcus sp. PCC 7502]|uniref:DUF5777 family beta-barrel protein n=1 Tax=Synechococcus sp. PCC 7502 TaxID=1173263 RepID=UPI00029F9891|nr:DUF5777 family beta-barrel protein [Synechococcus sp. PCC 7502]AFY74827.1 hypothetical protein Syn7502_02899 [Synechococcus sp. PCC 7502]